MSSSLLARTEVLPYAGCYVALALDIGGHLLTDDHRLAIAPMLPVAVLRLPQGPST